VEAIKEEAVMASPSRKFLRLLIDAAKKNPGLADALKAEMKENQDLYDALHAALKPAPKKPPPKQQKIKYKPLKPEEKSKSYGGVIIDDEGYVLLRKPNKFMEGTKLSWTFAKGGRDHGETPQDAALREVEEEMGVVAEIVAPLQGQHEGMGTMTRYYLMRPVEELPEFGVETHETIWATPEEAKKMLGESSHKLGRERDLAVLDQAVQMHEAIQKGGPPPGGKQPEEKQEGPTMKQRWEAFLEKFYQGGKKMVPNPDWAPDKSEQHKEIQMLTRMKKDLAYRDAIRGQFHKWIEEDGT
jgi:ADP-ribose pyrophosphatase YjhB (NUDIX family)